MRIPDLPRSRLRPVSLLTEVTAGLVQRPGRTLLTALGTILGVGTLVTIVGLTATAQEQIAGRFNALTATEVVVQQEASVAAVRAGSAYPAFPEDSSARVARVRGVRAGGVWWPALADGGGGSVSATFAGRPIDVAVYAADSGAVRALHPNWAAGRGYDRFHERRAARVAVLGRTAARVLGIRRLDSRPAVFIRGRAFTVVGIVGDAARNPEFLAGIMIPPSTALQIWGLPKEVRPQMTIETDLGAAARVAEQVPLALRPDHPEYFRTIAPPDPRSLEGQVSGDLNGLFVILALVSLLIGTFGIANTTLVAVLERVGEIGLRRAVGAKPGHIAIQFLAESGAIGMIGGLIGTSVGVFAVLATSVLKEWSAVMPSTLLLAPALGAVTGVLAGLYPAWRAVRVEPADALRR